jgi:hypothetical protein
MGIGPKYLSMNTARVSYSLKLRAVASFSFSTVVNRRSRSTLPSATGVGVGDGVGGGVGPLLAAATTVS